MSSFDVQALLQPLDPDPCGQNLEYDSDFVALEEASRGKPEQEYGDTKVPAEPPDWKQVRRLGLDLSSRTKDLRIACLLSRGLLAVDGVLSFCDLLQLVRGYIENFWEGIHPQLDPDEGNSPEWRVNTLSSLNNHATILAMLNATLVEGGPLGSFSFHDFEIARGDAAAPKGTSPPTMANIEAAMRHEGAEQLLAKEQTLLEGIEHLNSLESSITNVVGAANAASFSELRETLNKIHTELQSQLGRLDIGGENASEDAAADTVPRGDGEAPQPAAAPGEIRSRDDVISTLDRLCRYYDRHEPSSPLPLLLRRAQRLATMSFLDIVKELTPGGLNEAKSVGGVDEQSESV